MISYLPPLSDATKDTGFVRKDGGNRGAVPRAAWDGRGEEGLEGVGGGDEG